MVQATITLPKVFGSSMVLQRDAPVLLHGSDTPAAQLSIRYFGQQYTTVADGQGQWHVTLPKQAKGESTSITITSDRSPAVTLDDVVFGDVVICSGQSNMELGVMYTVNKSNTVAEAAQYSAKIRLLQVATLPQYFNVTSPQVHRRVCACICA